MDDNGFEIIFEEPQNLKNPQKPFQPVPSYPIDISPAPCYHIHNFTQAMRRRVSIQEWHRELRLVQAVQEGMLKMDFEPPSRIMKLAGTARYSSRVFMA